MVPIELYEFGEWMRMDWHYLDVICDSRKMRNESKHKELGWGLEAGLGTRDGCRGSRYCSKCGECPLVRTGYAWMAMPTLAVLTLRRYSGVSLDRP